MLEEKVSVVMSVYNESDEWLSVSVESILNQTFRNLEFIIVIDSLEQRIIKLLEKYKEKDKRVVLIQNEFNRGLVYSLNRGIKESTGDFIARMDADDISIPDRIEKQMETIKQKKVDFVFSEINLIDEKGQEIKVRKSKPVDSIQMRKIMKYGNISNHPTWLFNKKIYKSLNGYRNIPNCEDQDFILRAILTGFTIYKIGESLLNYRIRSNSISRMNSLDQFLTSRSIRKLYNSKKLLEEMPGRYDLTLNDKEKFILAQNEFLVGVGALNNHKIKGGLKIFFSTFKSKYMFLSQIDLFKFKIVSKSL